MLPIHKKRKNVWFWCHVFKFYRWATITTTDSTQYGSGSTEGGGKQSCPTSHNVNLFFHLMQLEKLKAQLAKYGGNNTPTTLGLLLAIFVNRGTVTKDWSCGGVLIACFFSLETHFSADAPVCCVLNHIYLSWPHSHFRFKFKNFYFQISPLLHLTLLYFNTWCDVFISQTTYI